MKRLYQRLTGWWTAFALAASLAMLGAAHAFERVAGLAPCNLCLKQREVYWAAVAIAGAATFWAVFSRASRGTPRIASFLLAAVFFTGAITAGFHAGGELKWWDLPATCSAIPSTTIDLSALSALADGTAEMKPIVGCGDVAWSFGGVSMAGWNFIISLALAVFSLLAAKRPKDARAPKA
ncbi:MULTISPECIES: disulfide bond formation protein B [unclassified Brevundimonas]|uniref:disulfide bond formation protein B n=1 Tax=unclassified Brevundimonas TaxID=2622653 RepID=UPI0025C3EE90|nr:MULTISPECIES: disulfide bond formation protein B [unclassified Brevundimonas]